MTTDRLRDARDCRPFKPFEIRTSDGKTVTVTNPDGLAWDEESRTVVFLSASKMDIIDLDLITALGVEPARWPKKGKGK
jgi:hypothetical protein